MLAALAALLVPGRVAVASEPTAAELKTAAGEFFRRHTPYSAFIATDKGSRGYDDSSIRAFRSSYVKTVAQDGCRLTIANDVATIGDPRKGTHRDGPATITVDWGRLVEIDDSVVHADPMETGIVLRGGISTSVKSTPALRVMGPSAGDWAWHAANLKRLCQARPQAAGL